MPGTNGRRTAERLREAWPEMAIVFASGYPPIDENMPERATMIAKPFAVKELLVAVRRSMAAQV
jgi:FixJ family two-component response regulator